MNREFKSAGIVLLFVALAVLSVPASAHPILSDDDANKSWHAPEGSKEAVYIGSDKVAPLLMIKKSVVQSQSCSMTINADGRWAMLSSGSISIPIQLSKESGTTIKLDGAAEQPALFVNNTEIISAKGKWIQILADSAPAITLELTSSTFANIKFSSSDADAGVLANDTALADPEASASDPTNVALARAKHGIFRLHIIRAGKELRSGSAFLIDRSGKAITSYHLVHGGSSATASAAGHDEQQLPAELIGAFPEVDLALVRVHVEDAAEADSTPLEMAPDSPKQGQKVFSLGFSDAGYSVNKGAVKLTHKFQDLPDDVKRALGDSPPDAWWIQSSSKITKGNAGGPLVDDKGRVIGVNTWRWMESQDSFFSIGDPQIDALIAKANSNPVSFVTDSNRNLARGLASTHNVPSDLPEIELLTSVTPEQMLQSARDYRLNGLKACPICFGKGQITTKVKVGEETGGGWVKPVYRDSASVCTRCNGTGRAMASPDALDRLTDKLLTALASAKTEDKNYPDRLQAVTNILDDTAANDFDAQRWYTKETSSSMAMASTKPGKGFILTGTVLFTEPAPKGDGQVIGIRMAYNEQRTNVVFTDSVRMRVNNDLTVTSSERQFGQIIYGITVLLNNPRIIDAAEGDRIVAGGVFAGRAGNATSKMVVLQNGFAIRIGAQPRPDYFKSNSK